MKPEQFQVVSSIISGKDDFAVCQLAWEEPVFCVPTDRVADRRAIVLVVAPLTTIMKDQGLASNV